MALCIYPRTDGAYLLFKDDADHRYAIEQVLAAAVYDRLGAHLPGEPDRTLLDRRRVRRDVNRDRTVVEVYFQECDNFFEIITKTGPHIQATALEIGTILQYSMGNLAPPRRRWPLATLPYTVDPAAIGVTSLDFTNGLPYG